MRETQGREIWGRATRVCQTSVFLFQGAGDSPAEAATSSGSSSSGHQRAAIVGASARLAAFGGAFRGSRVFRARRESRTNELVSVLCGAGGTALTTLAPRLAAANFHLLADWRQWAPKLGARSPAQMARPSALRRRLQPPAAQGWLWAQSFNCRLFQGAKCGNLGLLNESRSWPPPPVSHLEACCKGEKRKETFNFVLMCMITF